MLFLTAKGNRPVIFLLFFFPRYSFYLFTIRFSPPLEEMRDLIESSEADSTATVSIQSKGKGVERALTLLCRRANISRTSLFINRFLLVLLSSAELKFPPPDESSAPCSRVLHSFRPPCLCFPPPVCLHLLLSVGARRQPVSVDELLQGQMHL